MPAFTLRFALDGSTISRLPAGRAPLAGRGAPIGVRLSAALVLAGWLPLAAAGTNATTTDFPQVQLNAGENAFPATVNRNRNKPDTAARTASPPPPRPADHIELPVFRRHAEATTVAPDVLAGYASLQAGDWSRARTAYARALQRNPDDVASLLALAAITAAQGDTDVARDLRRRAYAMSPDDPATLAAYHGALDGEPVHAASRLRSALARQPAPSLEFALGNVLAADQRWAEARAAYFRALTGDADNPDYLFNLAVSLEHLRQPRAAAEYYGQALTAANRRAAAFDTGQAAERIRQLNHGETSNEDGR